MLVLARKPGEVIVLDGGIRITVVSCDAGSVRLGIEAPSSVSIHREEVLERIAEENRRALLGEDEMAAALELLEGRGSDEGKGE